MPDCPEHCCFLLKSTSYLGPCGCLKDTARCIQRAGFANKFGLLRKPLNSVLWQMPARLVAQDVASAHALVFGRIR